MVGNKTALQNLFEWLQDWYELFGGQLDKKPIQHTREKNKPVNDPNARSCLISGPPGIGKTSAVNIIAQQLNFDVMCLNASDTRSKVAIQDLLSDLSQH